MDSQRIKVTGLFSDDRQAARAIENLKCNWTLSGVHGPVASEHLARALKMKKTPVGWFTLTGGIIGLFTGYLLAAFTALRWEMIISGKPVVAIVPFLIVGFEFAVLFSIFGNVIGLILLARLPAYGDIEEYPAQASGNHFALVIACKPQEMEEVKNFLQDRGGTIASR